MPYVKKSYNLLKLLLSEILTDSPPPTINTSTYENIEVPLNILLLTLHQKYGVQFENQDFSSQEIDVASFIVKNAAASNKIFDKRLLNMDQLHFIAENRHQFYPFGTIKSYTALSILLSQSNAGQTPNAYGKYGSFDELLSLMKSISVDTEIDDVSNAAWEFINSILASGELNLEHIGNDRWLAVLSCLQHITLTYKSAELR